MDTHEICASWSLNYDSEYNTWTVMYEEVFDTLEEAREFALKAGDLSV